MEFCKLMLMMAGEMGFFEEYEIIKSVYFIQFKHNCISQIGALISINEFSVSSFRLKNKA